MNKLVKDHISQNKIERIAAEDQSQFRVHFYIKSVYYSSNRRLQAFLNQIADIITKIYPVATLQVFGSITKLVDLSVGLKSDTHALELLQSNLKIFIKGEDKIFHEYEPIFSQSFKMYALRMKKQSQKGLQILQTPPSKKESYRQFNLPEVLSSERRPSNEIHSSKHLDLISLHNFIYIFGVPLEYKEKDISFLLSQNKIHSKYCEFILKEDIEYLFVELYESLNQHYINSLDLAIDRSPLLIAFKSREENINDVLIKYQVEITFEKEIDQIQFIRYANQIGNVIHIIKDVLSGPRKYIVAFSRIIKVHSFCQVVQKHYKHVVIRKPKNPLRICRLERQFSFWLTMENLAMNEQEMQRLQAPQNQK